MKDFKAILLVRRRELVEAISRAEAEGKGAATGEPGDAADRAVQDTTADGSFRTSQSDSETLNRVDEALARIEEGSFGKCVICGKEIEPARLAAIPWTPYCLADEEKKERAAGTSVTPTL